MQPLFSLLTAPPYIELPSHWPGWVGWVLLFGLLAWGTWRSWEKPVSRDAWKWLAMAGVLVAVPITSLFLGLRLSDGNVIPAVGAPAEHFKPAVLFLSAIPWMLAAVLWGAVPAVGVALFSGLILGLWETHSLFTMLRTAGLALFFSAAIRQRYRTPVFRVLRHPLPSAVLLAFAFIPFHMLVTFLGTDGSLAARLDYSLTLPWLLILARAVEFVIAGVAGEAVYLYSGHALESNTPLTPSPLEKSLQNRFFYRTTPFLLILMLALMVAVWGASGNTARQIVKDRLSGPARMAAESLPSFFDVGPNLVSSISDPGLLALSPRDAGYELALQLKAVPYFRSLYLLDRHGSPVNGYPVSDFSRLQIAAEEEAGIQLALRGVPVQTYILPAWPGETAAQISYIAAIFGEDRTVQGVLLARTDLSSNPFTRPAIAAMEAVTSGGGEAAILDENHRILYHSLPKGVLAEYPGKLPLEAGLVENVSSAGAGQMVFYQPVLGRPWSIMLSLPQEQVRQLTLSLASPLLALLVAVCAAVFLLLRFNFRKITNSLESLAQEATLISQGLLDNTLSSSGEDEVAQFGRAFEKMRLSLRARLEELSRFLQVSQGVASNLHVEKAVYPILQAAMFDDASVVRIVLVKEVTLLEDNRASLVSFGLGKGVNRYSHLDQQLFEQTQHHDVFTIPNLPRTRRMTIDPALPKPGALISLPIHQEDRYYGALWVGFDAPRNFTEDEVKFLGTLADQAAIAATNAKLYATSEIGRQRLEAVLTSTPEPVLVIDELSRLSVLNPAALQVPGLITAALPGSPIKDVISNGQLLDLILSTSEDRLSSREIPFPDDRVYFASVSPVIAENKSVGKICMLRDITHYKELDTLKSDFVSTVSHDLRSPLTLMRGYATMIQMVGDLNEQQKAYVEKIVTGVENMSRLVTNLLDLGRIEAGVGLQIERVSANDMLVDVVNSLQPQAVQKNIRVRQEIVNEIPTMPDIYVEVDRALMQQALFNLVDNAIKYTKVGGQVETRLVSRGQLVLYEVKDTGIGVAPLDLPHMFEKFYRTGRHEAYVDRGTGLGLAIVKSIIDRHGGRIWVESQLGRGSTFFIEIPAKHNGKNRI